MKEIGLSPMGLFTICMYHWFEVKEILSWRLVNILILIFIDGVSTGGSAETCGDSSDPLILKKKCESIVDRPGKSRAVLQTSLLLVHSVGHWVSHPLCENIFNNT